MPHLEIQPHLGAGPIRLGAKRDEVRAAMKAFGLALSDSRGALDWFGPENTVQVEYTDGTASFIGLSPGLETFTCSICGVDPFDTAARELFSVLAKHDGGTHRFNEDEYCFPNTGVTLYEADAQYDLKHGTRPVWSQVGIGDARYLAATKTKEG